MIGFNDTAMMMAHLRRKGPQGGGLGVRFAANVGVSPGTTTLCLSCQQGQSNPISGPTLMQGDCPPDPTNQYMVDRAAIARAIAPAAQVLQKYEPYGTESTLKGLHGTLRDTTGPFGMSWNSIIILAGVAALGGVGIGYLATRR